MLTYLARYTHRVAISNHLLLRLNGDRVTFTYKEYTQGGRVREMTLPAEEFIRRFLLHLLPEGFVRIRYYGLFANRHRAGNLARCRELLTGAAELGAAETPAREAWQARLARLTGKDPSPVPQVRPGSPPSSGGVGARALWRNAGKVSALRRAWAHGVFASSQFEGPGRSVVSSGL